MARAVFLHIGARKTGTSAIQVALVRNKELLAENGFIYPESDSEERARQGKVTSGNGSLLAGLLDESTTIAGRRRSRAHLLEMLAANPHHSLVYSSELFETCSAERIGSFIDLVRASGAEVKIIYYVRHLLDYAISSYSQAVKRGGHTRDFRNYIRSHKIVFARTIKTYSCFVRREDFFLRLYDRARSNLIVDFFEILLGARMNTLREKIAIERKPINRSLTIDEMQALLVVNRISAKYGYSIARTLSRQISDHLIEATDAKATPFIVTPDELAKFKRNNAGEIEYINGFAGDDFGLDFAGSDILIGPRPNAQSGPKDEMYFTVLEYLVDQIAAAPGKVWPFRESLLGLTTTLSKTAGWFRATP